MSEGFAERDEAGEAAEEELVRYARRHGMRLVGPNALGVINTDPLVGLHATFVGVNPVPGRIGLMAQSGVIGAAIIEGATQLGLGLSSFVAVGNKADVSGNDLLRYWLDDPGTDVAMLYLESFGNPSKFSRIARALSRVKPVVAVKVGGERADHWHGEDDLVGDEATVAALLEQTGIVRVENLTQMFHTAGVLANQPLPAGRRVAVVTNAWGPAWLAVDALRAWDLEPARPINLSNDASADRFAEQVAELYADPDVDSVLVVYAPGLRTHYKRVAAALREVATRPDAVTTVACLLGNRNVGLLADERVRVPEFPFPEEAAMALGRVTRYANWRRAEVGEAFVPAEDAIAAAKRKVQTWLEDSQNLDDQGRRILGVVESDELLAAVGLDSVRQEVVQDADGAVVAARRIGYPVALKAGGLERLSKTEAGGVALDVHGDEEVRAAFGRMEQVLGEGMFPAIVQAMVPEGIECRIGIARTPVVGDLVTLGVGGALAERVGDQSVRLFPVTDRDADLLIDESAVGSLIDESDPEGRAALRDVLVRLAGLADAIPEIVRIRLNPVIVAEGSARITDIRVLLAHHLPDTRPPVRRL
ncbi:MAG: acetate--CoA ligase family protein [Acidimicrobiales bacterium]|nr:acetate--CoA ligase family protein [Acidimicrobiales bacterium]